MNPFQVENTELFERSAIGRTRLFVKPGTFYGFTAEHPFVYQGLAEVAIPTLTRSEPSEAELPSDIDGSTTVTVTTGLGSYEKITGTITQPMNQRMEEGYWEIFRQNVPFAMWLPNGAIRQLDDPNDHTSGWLVDRAYINSIGPDNNANQRDKTTVNEWFNLSIEYAASSADIHIIAPSTFRNEKTSRKEFISVAVSESQSGTNLVAITEPQSAVTADTTSTPPVTAATAEAPLIFLRDYNGEWDDGRAVDLGSDQKIDDIATVGAFIIGVSDAAVSHVAINIADLREGILTTSVVSGYTTARGPRAIYAAAPGYMLAVGTGGYIYKLSSILAKPVIKDAGAATTSNLLDVHGLKSQAVAVGADNTVVITGDFGETWKSVTGPSGTATDDLLTVFMTSENVFLIGSDAGKLYRTENFGKTFSEVLLGFEVTKVTDMVFKRNEVNQSLLGFLTAETSSEGVIAKSIDAGASWSQSTNHVASTPDNITNMYKVQFCNLNPKKAIIAAKSSNHEEEGNILVAS